MKKFIACLLVMAMAFSFSAFAKSSFTDISKSEYKKAIEKLYSMEVIDGYSKTEFGPNDTLSRAQAAQILVNALYGENAVKFNVITFADVSMNSWYYRAVNTAYYYGIAHGTGDGNFNPDGNVSYNEFATMLLNILGYDTSINWPTGVQQTATSLKLYNGLDFIYNGAYPITRGEACQMLYNALDVKIFGTRGTLYEAMGFEYEEKKDDSEEETTKPTSGIVTGESYTVMFGYAFSYGDGYTGLRVYIDNENGTYTEVKTAGTVAAEYIFCGETYEKFQLYDKDYNYVDLHTSDEIFFELTYPGSGVYKITKVICHHGNDGVTDWPDTSIPVDGTPDNGPGSNGDAVTRPSDFLVP